MTDSSEKDEPQETPTSHSEQPQVEREVDLSEEDVDPPYVAPGTPSGSHETPMPEPQPGAEEPVPAPEPLPLAEPGVYVCKVENAGEHALLGRLDYDVEYDYSQEHNPEKLAAIAACCESGLLEKK